MGIQVNDMILHSAGGRIPLSALRRAAEIAMVYGNGNLRLGSRQEIILCAIPGSNRDRVRRDMGSLLIEHHPRRPNIVTTRPVCGRADRTPWLSDGTFDSVLAQFVSPPALPVNFSDPRQGYLPLHTGQINFLATAEPSFWQVSFHTRDQLRPVMLSTAVHSDGVAAATFVIQQAILRDNGTNLPELQRDLEACLGTLLRDGAPSLPAVREESRPITGFDADSAGETCTLGIPAFNQPLPGQFLVDLCLAARKISIATAGVTPWQSLLIHGIPASDRLVFERLLIQHQVSLHTGAWDHVCSEGFVTPQALREGRSLIAALNEHFPCPGPLRIGFAENNATVPDTPIVVRADYRATRWPFRPRPRYTVYVRENFERDNPMLIPWGRDLNARGLVDTVLDVVMRFGAGQVAANPVQSATVRHRTGLPLHQCMECQTEYSEQYGDPLGGVDAGTPFAELPADWCCPTCGAPQSKYITTRGFAA
jgi:rubredoxin